MQNEMIHIKGKLYSFNELWIMAILNLSEDSFYTYYSTKKDAPFLHYIEKLISAGANIIDIGAASTRPNATIISVDEEKKRIGNSISLIKNKFPSVLVSVDTISEDVINFAIREGADIINDISGGDLSDDSINNISKNKLAYILTYNRGGKVNNITNDHLDTIISDALLFFSEKLNFFAEKNLIDVILDPGFGFNKSIDDNYKLLKQSKDLLILERPLLFGLSRKSMIYKKLGVTPEQALNGSTILNTFASLMGAGILRVHDVEEATQLKKLITLLK